MTLDLIQIIYISGLGIIVGLISSLFGLGGGVLLIPLLPFIVPFEPSETVMISLICITAIVSLNLWAFNRQKIVSWPLVWRLGIMAAVGGFVASQMALSFDGVVIRWITGVVLILLAIRMIFFGKNDAPEFLKKHRALMPMSFVAGYFSGLVGVGTGAIMGPVLYGTRVIEDRMVSPTINGMLVLAALTATISYVYKSVSGDWIELTAIHYEVVIIVSFFSGISSFWGRRQQLGIDPELRRKLLGGILFLLAGSTIVPLIL